jgi:hypothetical protein
MADTNWRIRPPSGLARIVEHLSRTEHRSVSEMLLRLVGEAVTGRGIICPSRTTDPEQEVADAKTIAVRSLPSWMLAAICNLADREGRTQAAAVRILLREALVARATAGLREAASDCSTST